MNIYKAHAIFMVLGLWPRSYSAMEESNVPMLSNQANGFIAMAKSNPDCLKSYRIRRLSEEYDKSMHAIFANAMLKPHSVLPNCFYSSDDAHAIIAPCEDLSKISWPQQNLACSYWCGLCNMKLQSSQEYDAHHCCRKNDAVGMMHHG